MALHQRVRNYIVGGAISGFNRTRFQHVLSFDDFLSLGGGTLQDSLNSLWSGIIISWKVR